MTDAAREFAARLNCPHCHSPIEGVASDEDEILCPSCGSSFRVEEDQTRTWTKGRLPTLGKFELIEAVGRGMFGTVYRARDTRLQRIVAVKVPRSGRLATDEDEDRFVREARNAAQLQHSGIVPVFEVGRSETFPYIISEFVEGITLADAMTARKFRFREVAELVRQVAEALEHAHGRGVVHRDLKPSNIMLTPDGTARVMDFGLAKRDAGEVTVTVEGALLGTPAYMSPEQAAGHAHQVDGRGDIYSLGSILYELLTGELPFRGNQRMLLYQVLHEEPRQLRSLNDRIPRDLETIGLKAMAKEPSRRYQSAQAMADDLTRWLNGEPIVARPVGRLERGWRWCRRRPTVAILAATVLVSLLAGSGVSTYFAVESRRRADDALAEKARADAEAAEAISQTARADQKAAEATTNAEKAAAAGAQARLAAEQATTEAKKATRVAEFLAGMFEASAPRQFPGTGFSIMRFTRPQGSQGDKNLTAHELLERGGKKVVEELSDQPAVQAALMDTIANVFMGLGLGDKAEPLVEKALAIRRRLNPGGDLETANNLQTLSYLRLLFGNFEESLAASRESLAIRKKMLGDDNEAVIDVKFMSAILLAFESYSRGEFSPDAEAMAREVLIWRLEHLGENDRDTAYAMIGMGGILLNKFELMRAVDATEAFGLFTKAMEILERDPETRAMANAMIAFQKSRAAWVLGQSSRAASLSAEAIERFREAVGEGHPLFSMIAVMHVPALLQAGRIDEAERFCEGWERELAQCGEERNHLLARAQCHRVAILCAKARRQDDPRLLDDAEELWRKSIANVQKLDLPPMNEQVEAVRAVCEQLERHAPDRALALARHLYQVAEQSWQERMAKQRLLKLNIASLGSAALLLGPALARRGRLDEAEAIYWEMAEKSRRSSDSFWTMRFTKALGDVKLKQGDVADAERLYRESLDLVKSFRVTNRFAASDWESANLNGLAECSKAQGDADQAEGIYRRVIVLGDRFWSHSAKIDLAALLSEKGAGDEATRLLRSILTSPPGDWEDHANWTRAWSTLWKVMRKQGADKPALVSMTKQLEAALAAARKKAAAPGEVIAELLVNLGSAYCDILELERAEPILKEALETRRQLFRADAWQCANAEVLLGECLNSLSRSSEAEPLLLTGYTNLLAALGPKDARVVRALEQLVRLYESLQQPDKAAEYRKLLTHDQRAASK